MDNTDGLAQSLTEIARESSCAMLISGEWLELDELVIESAAKRGTDPVEFAFGPGADFGLVGTLSGQWPSQRLAQTFGPGIHAIGTVIDGAGLFLRSHGVTRAFAVPGWNYFQERAG